MSNIARLLYTYILDCLSCLNAEDQIHSELSQPISPVEQPLRIKIPEERPEIPVEIVQKWQEDPLYRAERPPHI
jgi:hypothetical protein